MASIRTLEDIEKTYGKQFLDDLLSRKVTITEKVDGSRLSLGRRGDHVLFYKKNDTTPINYIDRTLVQYYESPINHLESMVNGKIDEIPEDYRFGFMYLPELKTNYIRYNYTPKNYLILTDITIRRNGKVKKVIDDYDELKKWANFFDVDDPPILFQGYLNQKQKDEVRDFVYKKNSNQDRQKYYKTSNFVKFLLRIVTSDISKKKLNYKSDDSNIEGVVFKFYRKNGKEKDYTAKIVNPYVSKVFNKGDEESGEQFNNLYYFLLIDFLNYLQVTDLSKYRVNSRLPKDQRYVNFMSKIFVNFIKYFGSRYDNIDFEKPEILKSKNFDINFDNVSVKAAKDLIESNENYKEVFKILLSAFRKKKKKTTEFFTKNILHKFNEYVKKIDNYLENYSLSEENTFENNSYSIDDESDEDDLVEITFDEDKVMSYEEDPNDPQSYDQEELLIDYEYEKSENYYESYLERNENIKENECWKFEFNDNNTLVNVVLDDFQPVTLEHLSYSFDSSLNGLQSVAVCVCSEHLFGQSFTESLLSSMVDSQDNNYINYIISNAGSLSTIFEKLNQSGYKVNKLIVNKSDFGDLSQSVLESDSNKRVVCVDFDIFKNYVNEQFNFNNWNRIKHSVPSYVYYEMVNHFE